MRRSALVPTIAVGGLLALSPASFGAVTIGSDLNPAPDTWIGNSANTFTLAQLTPAGGPALQSPMIGVVVRGRIRTDGGSTDHPFRLRVLRPNLTAGTGTGVATGPAETPPVGSTMHTFNARLPISAGDGVGVDGAPTPAGGPPQPGQPFGAYLASVGGSLVPDWIPALADGQTRAPSSVNSDLELLVNADVEPDGDRDGYGDESQDRCPIDAFPAGGPCVAPVTMRVGGNRTQRVLRQKGVVVTGECPNENCTIAAEGTANVPTVRKANVAKRFRLRRVSKAVAPGQRARLKLRFGARLLKAVRRALKARRRVTFAVKVTARDAAGNVATARRTIRARR
jgi:hypothetical protein